VNPVAGRALRVGLTGGVASGKSTVAKLFADLGAGIVDTDEIARELVRPGNPALAAIVELFGRDVLAQDGTLDRRRLRAIVFGDAARRLELEAILHPPIRAEALARAAASTAPYVMIVVPLLFESGFDRLVDRTLVVDCSEAEQMGRLTARDGIGEPEARAMLAAQMPRSERRAAADDSIDNSGPLESTSAEVQLLNERYLRLAQNCPRPPARAE
jgi:dephospho-CoA kinase